MSSTTVPRVSVIVAARNAADSMPALLAGLRGQTLPADQYEVLIVDDCSTDETAELVERSGFARLLRTPQRGGAYVARNLALSEARGQVIAITDADCRPSPQWLEAGLQDLEALDAEVIGGHVDVPLRDKPSLAELVDYAGFLDQQRALDEAGFVATANLFAGRDVFDAVGAFNDNLISGGDRDWSWRAAATGYRLAYSPRASVLHPPRLTGRELAKKCYRMGRGRAQQHAHAEGAMRSRPRIWSRPGAYLIRRHVYGVERLYKNGYQPSRLELTGMSLARYFFVQLPQIAGNLVGSFRQSVSA